MPTLGRPMSATVPARPGVATRPARRRVRAWASAAIGAGVSIPHARPMSLRRSAGKRNRFRATMAESEKPTSDASEARREARARRRAREARADAEAQREGRRERRRGASAAAGAASETAAEDEALERRYVRRGVRAALAAARDRARVAGALLLRAAAAHAERAVGPVRAQRRRSRAPDRAQSARRDGPRARGRRQLAPAPERPRPAAAAVHVDRARLQDLRSPRVGGARAARALGRRSASSRRTAGSRASSIAAPASSRPSRSPRCRSTSSQSRTMLGDVVMMSAFAMSFGGLLVARLRSRRRGRRPTSRRASRGS